LDNKASYSSMYQFSARSPRYFWRFCQNCPETRRKTKFFIHPLSEDAKKREIVQKSSTFPQTFMDSVIPAFAYSWSPNLPLNYSQKIPTIAPAMIPAMIWILMQAVRFLWDLGSFVGLT